MSAVSSAGNAETTPVVTMLRPVPQSAPRARAVVREALIDSPNEAILDQAELCASELVTNAVLHAGTELRLEIRFTVSGLRLRVSDGSPKAPVLSRHTRTASTGRGLAMVAAIADAWGVEDHPGDGKTIWCDLSDRGSDGEPVDIAEVMDAWDEVTAGAPSASADPGIPRTASVVTLRGYPVVLGMRLQEHYEAMVRECQLLAAPRPDGAARLPERLLGLALALAQRYTDELSDLARPDPRRVAAQAQGRDVVDLTYPVSPEQLQRLQSWQTILDDVDDFSARGDLMAPTISPALARLRGWALAEFVRQSDGAPPTPWTGGLG